MRQSIKADEQERKLFVGNLSKDATDENELKKYFGTYGKIIDASVMRNKVGCSRGFGFVLFDNTEAIDQIMSLKRDGEDFVVNSTKVYLKRALPQVSNSKAASLRPDYRKVSDNRKVFVGGLPAIITEKDLQHYFEQFGKVVQVELVKDRETNVLRGYAFITFGEEDVADMCIQRRNHEICRKICDVKRATFKSRDQGGQDKKTFPEMVPIEEVECLIRQAFLLGQLTAQGGLSQQNTDAFSFDGIATEIKNISPTQALLDQRNAKTPLSIGSVPAVHSPSSTSSVPSSSDAVLQIARLLHKLGVDTDTLATLLK